MKLKRFLALAHAFITLTTISLFGGCTDPDDLITTQFITVVKSTSTISVAKDELTILQLTDIQTSSMRDCDAAYPQVRALVQRTQPDMLVLTGDNISDGSSREVLNALITLLDGFQLPWALVFGNHDRNSNVPMLEMSEKIERASYSIFQTGNLLDRYGNYYYNVKLRDTFVRSLIFMDSAKTNFTTQQVSWYKDTIHSIQVQTGKMLPSFAFFHIPVREVIDAHELYKQDSSIGTGVQMEAVCAQDKNTGFFNAVKELGSTDALFYGHDHVNNTILNYQGVVLCYGLKTGTNSYYDAGLRGANLITITKDGYDIERVYHNS